MMWGSFATSTMIILLGIARPCVDALSLSAVLVLVRELHPSCFPVHGIWLGTLWFTRLRQYIKIRQTLLLRGSLVPIQVLTHRFHIVEVPTERSIDLQPNTEEKYLLLSAVVAHELRAPRRKHLHCWSQTLPLSETLFQPTGLRASMRNITTVGVKRFRCAEVFFHPRVYEPSDSAEHRPLCSLLLSASPCCHASRKRQRSSSTAVTYAWLVLLVTLQFSLFSRSLFSGPRCQALWWTAGFARDAALRAVFLIFGVRPAVPGIMVVWTKRPLRIRSASGLQVRRPFCIGESDEKVANSYHIIFKPVTVLVFPRSIVCILFWLSTVLLVVRVSGFEHEPESAFFPFPVTFVGQGEVDQQSSKDHCGDRAQGCSHDKSR